MERRTPDEPSPGKVEYERGAAFRAQERNAAEAARSQQKAIEAEAARSQQKAIEAEAARSQQKAIEAEPPPGKLEYERGAAFRAQERKAAEAARSQPKAIEAEPPPGKLEYERKVASRVKKRPPKPTSEIGTAKAPKLNDSEFFRKSKREKMEEVAGREPRMRIPVKGNVDPDIEGRGGRLRIRRPRKPRGELPESDGAVSQLERHLLPPYHRIGEAKTPDEKKREAIKAAPGAIAWPQGELRGKKAWHVVVEPYSQATHHVVVGEKPEGATLLSGPQEAYKRIVQAAGKGPQRSVRREGGAVDPVLFRKGRTAITFVPDKTFKRKRGGGRLAKVAARPTNLAVDVVVTRSRRGRKRHISLY